MIIAENIYKCYNKTTALEDINFSINQAELFGFIGPDGAGKTTLFRIITTLVLPDKGRMSVMGLDVDKDYRELRKHIGYMPGRFSLYQDLTVAENLKFYATIFGTTIEKNYHLIKDIYSHIEPFKDRIAGKLSGGMKQKLALSCALIHAPRLIVLDEPTTGVDAVSRTEFWEMLKKLKDENITIVVSTPYMDEANRCDRVALIQEGKILKTDTPANIPKDYRHDLFAVSASNRYMLIQALKTHPDINSVNAFGDSVHINYLNNKPDMNLNKYLENKGLDKINIKKIEPGIEDVFLNLMEKNGTQR